MKGDAGRGEHEGLYAPVYVVLQREGAEKGRNGRA